MNYLGYISSRCLLLLDFISIQVMAIMIIQPILVLFIYNTMPYNIPLISVTIGFALVISVYLAKHDLRSHLLYYWIVMSVSYTIIVYELIVLPLFVIAIYENFLLVLFTTLSIFFLYLTVSNNNKLLNVEDCNSKTKLKNGNDCLTSICPACRVKMHPRNYHCQICQECIQRYDHHSYWLNCCIGENNIHFYMSGILFGIFALVYASLLILTTICSPEFKFGILIPVDCSDIGENIEVCTCLVCGIYLLELAVVLLFKFIYHFCLISKGYSMFEWKERNGYSICRKSPYSLGLINNWLNFFKKFKKNSIIEL